MKRGCEVYLDANIKNSIHNLRSTSGGCIEGTHNILRDKSHSCCKVDLKTLNELWGVQQAQFPKID